MLEFISGSTDMNFLSDFYSITLTALEESNNERLLTKTNLKLAKLYLDRKELNCLSKVA
jgi:COP9 signalosome complex subunit 2